MLSWISPMPDHSIASIMIGLLSVYDTGRADVVIVDEKKQKETFNIRKALKKYSNQIV
jgi:hypothetical protein